MAIFDLDEDYSASFVPYRHGFGFVAKGTIFRSGKAVEIFEAHGLTLPITTRAAWAKVEEIVCRLKTEKRPKAKPRKENRW